MTILLYYSSRLLLSIKNIKKRRPENARTTLAVLLKLVMENQKVLGPPPAGGLPRILHANFPWADRRDTGTLQMSDRVYI